MLSKTRWLCYILFFALLPYKALGEDAGLGQTIQITTRFKSFIGHPTWLIIIRDLDNNQNLPYLFDISRNDNFWVAFSYSHRYLITASTLQIETYRSRQNKYGNYKINNFCNLESNGRILRGESLFVTVTGSLTSNANSVRCHVSSFKDPSFTVVN